MAKQIVKTVDFAANLNNDEQQVLAALYLAAMDASEGAFGILDEAFYSGLNKWLTKKQFGGYISQLVQKGFIHYADGGQYVFSQKSREYFDIA